MDNTITARFNGERITRTEPLWQYDYGQKLILSDIDLPSAYEVHFSDEQNGESKTSLGDETGVLIPDEFLLSGRNVYAWVYLHTTENDGGTKYMVTIPVRNRSQPSDTPPTPVEQSLIEQTLAALESAVEDTEALAASIPTAIDTALQEAKDSGEFDGADGFSPTLTVEEITGGHEITITDIVETKVVDVMDGVDGADGADGKTPSFSIGTVTTGDPGSPADASITGTDMNPVLNLTIPKGEPGSDVIDDTAGDGNVTHTWSADKLVDEFGGKISTSLKGAASGVAELDANGKVPAAQLPAYVDDVEEYASLSAFPSTGESGKIYIALDTNTTYRWGGSTYVEIGSSLALGETESTAYRGDRGATAYAAAVTNVDSSPTSASTNLVTSGGVYTELALKAPKADPVFTGSISMDRSDNSTVGQLSVAVGEDVTASGYGSFAEGGLTTASGNYDHAEGRETVASGSRSHAEGSHTTASGYISHAEGSETTASGNLSHAEGANTVASGTHSHAEGCGSSSAVTYNYYSSFSSSTSNHDRDVITGSVSKIPAAGDDSHTEGYQTCAEGTNTPGRHAEGYQTYIATGASAGHAEGYKTYVDGSNGAHAEGFETYANGTAAHAEGYGSAAKSSVGTHAEGYYTYVDSGNGAHAEGSLTYAQGEGSHAEGQNTMATGSYGAHAEGMYTTASGSYGSHAEGEYTWANDYYSHAEGYGGSFTGLDGSTYTSMANGTAAHSEGYLTYAGGSVPGSHSEGYLTVASGGTAHAEGNKTLAAGNYSHSEGYQTRATGSNGAHAEGQDTAASGNASHAEGFGGTYTSGNVIYRYEARGTADHVEGFYCETQSNQPGNHAEGYMTKATGGAAHSEGGYTTASGNLSHAEGSNTQATDYAAHAEGNNAVASGTASHAEGKYTIASGHAIHAEGEYNVASPVATAPPTWVGGTSYAVGDRVTRNGAWYQCKTANSDSSFNSSKWYSMTVRLKQVHIVGNGVHQDARANAYALDWDGTGHFGGDVYVNCDADSSNGKKVAVTDSPVFTNAISMGRKANTTVGYNSVAVGSDAEASTFCAVAEGYKTVASGTFSHAEGLGGAISGPFGNYTSGATSQAAHSEGFLTASSGDGSHSEGYITVAAGAGAHSEGNQTYALANAAHTEGYFTKTEYPYTHVEGIWNVPPEAATTPDAWVAGTSYEVGDIVSYGTAWYWCRTANSDSSFTDSHWGFIYWRSKQAYVVGNGYALTDQANAYSLDWDGTGHYAGDVYVGCNADSSGGTKLAKITDIPDISGKISSSEKGAANGVAELDANGLVPTSQLPGYVDDVLEYSSTSAFPGTGETGKIYVALDTNLTYRWGGSEYVEISPSLALGETSSTAYRGDRGADAYAAAVTNVETSPSSGSSNLITSGAVYTAVNGVLPAVSSTDNGKVLMVVDGAWAAATLSSATGVSF